MPGAYTGAPVKHGGDQAICRATGIAVVVALCIKVRPQQTTCDNTSLVATTLDCEYQAIFCLGYNFIRWRSHEQRNYTIRKDTTRSTGMSPVE